MKVTTMIATTTYILPIFLKKSVPLPCANSKLAVSSNKKDRVAFLITETKSKLKQYFRIFRKIIHGIFFFLCQ